MSLAMNFLDPIGPRRVPGTRPGPLTIRPQQAGFGGVMDGYMGALPAGYMGSSILRQAADTQPVPSREGAQLRLMAQDVVGVGGCGGLGGLGGKLDCNSTGRQVLETLAQIGSGALNAFGGKQGARAASVVNAGTGAWDAACQARTSSNTGGGGGSTAAPSSDVYIAQVLAAQAAAQQQQASAQRAADARRADTAAKAKSDQTKWLIGGALALGVVALVVLK